MSHGDFIPENPRLKWKYKVYQKGVVKGKKHLKGGEL